MTGSGTELDPYIITSAADLQAIENSLAAYYELGSNVDASGTSGWNGGLGFDPINNFSGQLDGKGYYVTGLFIDRPFVIQGDTGRVGLFELNMSGTIQNMGLVALSMRGQRVGPFANEVEVGGVISKCYATGNINADGTAWNGAFIYQNKGTISNCYSRVSVTGVSGTNWAGGFCYDNDGSIDDCYSTGALSATFNQGFCYGGDNNVTNCFWDTETSGIGTDGKGATGKTTTQMKTQSTFTDAGWDFSTPIWYMSGAVNDGYPAFTGPRAGYSQAHII